MAGMTIPSAKAAHMDSGGGMVRRKMSWISPRRIGQWSASIPSPSKWSLSIIAHILLSEKQCALRPLHLSAR